MGEQTIEMLIKMKFTAMADKYRDIFDNGAHDMLSFDEKLALIVEAEFYSKRNNKIKRLIKQARFNDGNASIGDVDYDPKRKLDKNQITTFSTNNYIHIHKNIIISGATGTGKSFLANALGIHACNHQYKVRYYRLTELFSDIELSKVQGTYRKFLK